MNKANGGDLNYSPYHEWGDDWLYWKDLGKAERYIYNYVYTRSRCVLISKEKYGTIRYERIFPPYGGVYIRKNWIDSILAVFGDKKIEYTDNKQQTHLFYRQKYYWHETKLYKLWGWWGKKVLDRAIRLAVKKFPECKQEILGDYDPRWL